MTRLVVVAASLLIFGAFLGLPSVAALDPTLILLISLAIVSELLAIRLPGLGFFSASFAANSTLALLASGGPALAAIVALIGFCLRTILHLRGPWQRELVTDCAAQFSSLCLIKAMGSHSVLVQIPASWLDLVVWQQVSLFLAGEMAAVDRILWRRQLRWILPHRLAAACLGPILMTSAGVGAPAALWVVPLIIGLHRAVHTEMLRAKLQESDFKEQQSRAQLAVAQRFLQVKESAERVLWQLSRDLNLSKSALATARVVCEAAQRHLACDEVAVLAGGVPLYRIPVGTAWPPWRADQAPPASFEGPLARDGVGLFWPLGGADVMYFGRRGGFTPEEQYLCAAIANQAALALQSARLYDEQPALLEGAKLAAVGQLAAGLAHEINTPLCSAALRLERVQMKLPDSRDVATGLEALERAQNLLKRLLFYSRDGSMRQQAVDVSLVLSETLDWAGLPNVIREIQPLPPVTGTPTELQQLFLQILENARYALAQPDAQGPGLLVVAEVEAARRKIVFRDQGAGIPPEILGRVCEAFFTAKPVGTGIGLGLTIAERIAVRHGGTLVVGNSNEPGWGAEITVWL